MLVLIAEDNLNTAELLIHLLEDMHYKTIHKSTADEIIDYLKNNSPDMMILDYILNDERATDILLTLRNNHITIPPFLVTTGFGDEIVAVEMMKLGARDYLIKDINYLTLLPVVIKRIDEEIQNETRRKDAEKKLKDATLFHEMVLESLDEAVHFVDTDLKIKLFNRKAKERCKEFGLEYNVIGKSLGDAFPFLSKKIIAEYKEILNTGKPIVEIGSNEFNGKNIVTETRRIPIFTDQKVTGIITIVKDISDNIQAQKELEKNKILLEETQQLSKVGGWEYDVVKKIMTWTKETFVIHGLDPKMSFESGQDYINNGLSCYSKKYRDEISAAFNKCIEDGTPYDMETPFTKFSGEKIWVRTTAKAISDDGKIVRIIGNIMDISDIKQANEKLEISKQSYIDIFNSVSEAIYIQDSEGTFIDVNRSAELLYGIHRKELIGSNPSIISVEGMNDLEAIKKKLNHTFKTGESTQFEFWAKRKNGEIFPKEVISNKGKYFGRDVLITTARDISERKRSEEYLKKNEKKFRTLVSNIPGIAYRCLNDENWTMIFFSENSKNITGYENTDFINNQVRSYESIIHPDDKEHVRIRVEKGIESQTIYSIEYRIIHADNSERWVIENGIAIKDEKNNLLYLDGVIMDITDRKRSEVMKENLEQKLRRAQKLETIGTLAGGIAHDFNNILTPIMGYSDMALTKISAFNPIYDDLQNILTASLRAKELVQQILVFSRQLETENQPLKPHLIVNEAVKLLRPSLPSTIKINLSLDKDSSYIMADPAQIHQVIINLCTNSFHAMEKTGGELSIELSDIQIDSKTVEEHSSLKEQKYVRLIIKDTGHGIEKLTMERIFEPFFTTKAVDKGTGMGLSVVHGIVQNHNGEIFVSSEPNKGTQFDIYFPAIEKVVEEKKESKIILKSGNERILIVDDEVSITKMTQRMLTNIGYEADITNSSQKALEMILENPEKYQLLLSDLTMPEMTGLILAKHLKSNNIEIPIIIMTGFGDSISEKEQVENNIEKLIIKPIIYNEFASCIRDVLDNSK